MAQFNFNAYQYDPSGSGGTWDEGKHHVYISESAIRPNKANTGTLLELTFKGASGAMAGRQLRNTYNIANPNPQSVEIAMNELSAIGIACGRPQIQDSAQWHGAQLVIDTVQEDRNDGKPGKVSRIVGYFDMQGQAPTKQGAQQTPPPQAPAQQQTPPPAQQPAPPPPQQQAPVQPQPNPNGGAPWETQQAPASAPPAGAAPPWQQGNAPSPQPGAAAAPPWATA
jgi:hypothetical protein